MDDNQSLRFSMNENIELEARLYEKEQQLVEKKKHFKRLTNLELLLADHKAKRAIHELLVKNGLARPRIKTEAEEEELDLLRIEIEKEGRK